MPNNAQPYQERAPTPKQDMQHQPQSTQRDPGIMPPRRVPMPRQGQQGDHAQQGQRDEGESNVKQSMRNSADIRHEANESVRSQQSQQSQGDGEPSGQPGLENEGEGNRTAARHYDEETEKFAKSGGVEPAAKEAERAYEGAEGDDLREAERRGREGKPS